MTLVSLIEQFHKLSSHPFSYRYQHSEMTRSCGYDY
uniref:Uncharacterized protein n=1 Tax=Arundo donax TaxID=35708 RepID=A0A0A9DFD0_ARUDO